MTLEDPVETVREPVVVQPGTSVKLLLQLQPKLLAGQLQLIGKADERTIRELLTRYDLTVIASPDVVDPMDRVHPAVDLNPQQATERIIAPQQFKLSPPAPLVTDISDHPETSTNPYRRQQAAAIIMATIALLNAVAQYFNLL